MKKRILGMLLALIMVLGLLPDFGFVATAAGDTCTHNEPSFVSETGAPFLNEGAANLLDGDTNTKWCSQMQTGTSVVFRFDAPMQIKSYVLTTGNDTGENPNRNWTSWTLYGSDSANGTWTEVHNVQNGALPQANSTSSAPFMVEDAPAYAYYKLVVHTVEHDESWTTIQQMSEIGFSLYCPTCGTETESGAAGGTVTPPEPDEPIASMTTADGTTEEFTDLRTAISTAAEAENSTLKLLDSIQTDREVTILGGTFTIDLNGYTWTCSEWGVNIGGTANITITDNSDAGGGKLLGMDYYYNTISLYGSACLEIAGGTVEHNNRQFTVDMSYSGDPTTSQLVVSGGRLVTKGDLLINAYGQSVTIIGGTLEGGSVAQIHYFTGLIDLSRHNDPTGITIYNSTNSDLTVSDSTFALPDGYVLLDSNGNAVTILTSWNTYTVGKGETPAPEPDEPVNYPLWVGGEQVTSANLSGGGWSFTPAQDDTPATLTLNNYTNSGQGYNGAALYYTGSDTLKLELIGDNTLSGNYYGVNLNYGSLTITGGRLNASGGQYGVNAGGSINITGSEVTASGGQYGVYAYEGSININDSEVTATGSVYGVCSFYSSITINAGEVIAQGNTRAFYKAPIISDTLAVYDADGNVIEDLDWLALKYAKIAASDGGGTTEPVNYDLWVGGERFTSEKLTINGGSGTATYDPGNNTLTLNNYSYTGEGYYGVALYYGGSDMLNLVLCGTNSVTHTGDNINNYSYGVFTNSGINISGDGSLCATSDAEYYDSYGVLAKGSITFTNSTVMATGGLYGVLANGSITFTNSTVTTTDGVYGVFANSIINITSTVDATGSNYGVVATQGPVTISGGSLTGTATGSNGIGVFTYGTITAENSSLSGTGDHYGVYADGRITLTDSTVNVSGNYYGIRSFYDTITISGGETIAQGNTRAFGAAPAITDTLTVYDADGNVIEDPVWTGEGALTYAKIAEKPPVTEYPLWVGGEQVTSADLSGEGWTYVPDTNTLTLDGYSVENQGYSGHAIFYNGKDLLNLVLMGENTLTATGKNGIYDGIYAYGEGLNISGTGSLTINANGNGIWAEYNMEISGISALNITIIGTSGVGVWSKTSINIHDVNTLSVQSDASGSIGIDAYDPTGTMTLSKINSLTVDVVARGIEGGNVGIHDSIAEINADRYGIFARGALDIRGSKVTTYGNLFGIQVVEDITINDSEVTAISGEDDGEVYSIYADSGLTITNSTVIAKAGDGTTKPSTSRGLSISYALTITNSKVVVTAGDAVNSIGIRASSISVTDGSTVTASAGDAVSSIGIDTGLIEVTNNSTVAASAGEAYNGGYGINAGSVSVTDGSTVTATAGDAVSEYGVSYGIYVDDTITISGGTTVAQGDKAAFSAAPIIADTFADAAVWYGENESAANAAGEKPIAELAENYNQKYVKVAEGTSAPSVIYTAVGAIAPGQTDGGIFGGSAWDPSAAENDLTWNESTGRYEITYYNVSATGETEDHDDTWYEFKIVENHSYDKSYGDTSGSGITFDIEQDGSTVIIAFDGEKALVEVVPPEGGTTDPVTEYPLWVGGVQVTSDNLYGEGWTYAPDTNTLTLNNYTYEGEGHGESNYHAAIYYGGSGTLELALSGTNSVTLSGYAYGISSAVYAHGSITISGDGELTAIGSQYGSSYGVDVEGDFTINGCSLSAAGTYCGVSVASDLTINGGSLSATGTNYGVHVGGDLTITDSTVSATGGEDDSESGSSVGIDALGAVTITNSEVVAIGGVSDHSCGIIASSVSVTDGSTVTVKSSDASGSSYGISVSGLFSITGSTVTVPVSAESPIICGIYVGSISVTDGSEVTVNIDTSDSYASGIMVTSEQITVDSSAVNVNVSTTGDDSYSHGFYLADALSITDSTVTATATATGDYSYSFGIYTEGKITISGGTTIAQGDTAAFSAAPIIADTFTDAAVWYGENESAANAAGEKPIAELAENYNQKYVKVAEETSATYTVTVTQPDGGNVAIDKENPVMGEEVTITVTPDAGKEVDKVTVKDETGNEIEVTDNGDGTYTYEQPAGDVTVEVTIKGSAGSQPVVPDLPGDYYEPTYRPTVEDTTGGDTTVSDLNPEKGDKVTIITDPDNGYEIGEIMVTDSKGNPVKFIDNGDGTYTYIQPVGKVTITVTYVPKEADFTDVHKRDYYYDAVNWAVAEGITNGITATTFAPDMVCTRAQAVTFLWRAAGSPEPKSTRMPFTDVAAGSYYYDAVLWAVENGITLGTSATTFSPNAECTRAQIVTFLWRAHGAPAVSGGVLFTDVADDAYYTAAIVWAVENGITNGTGANTFSPDAKCTRAQIVTFLYRSEGDEK